MIRDSVSHTIANRLSDPRITGLVSVTEVSLSPDTKNATVRLSVFGTDDEASQQTFLAIQHAVGPIQVALGKDLPGHTCPRLRFEMDTKTKKTLEVLNLIDQASREYKTTETDADEDAIVETVADPDEDADEDIEDAADEDDDGDAR